MFSHSISSHLKVFDMYQGFAQHHGWSFDILEHMTSELGLWTHALVIPARLKSQSGRGQIFVEHPRNSFCVVIEIGLCLIIIFIHLVYKKETQTPIAIFIKCLVLSNNKPIAQKYSLQNNAN